jgi:hypothetical protein
MVSTRRLHRLGSALLIGFAVATLASGAHAQPGVVVFEAALTGTQEAPTAVATSAQGTGTVFLFEAASRIHWIISHNVANATLAHFHGPGLPGVAAAIEVDIGAVSGLGSPMLGQAVLTPQQMADLLAGRWYINIHTSSFPAGEIRGQLAAATPRPVSIFPNSGVLTRVGAFDLILIVNAAGRTVVGATARLNGGDVTAAFLACVRPGTVLSGGQSFRCSVPGGVLAPGRNFLSIILTLSDNTSIGATATYDVEASTE